MTIVQIVLWIVAAAFVANFVLRAWGSGRLRPKNRPQLVRAGMDVTVILAGVRAIVPPPGWTSWLWVVVVVALGVGVAGVILRWRVWSPDPGGRSERWWPTAIYGVVAGALVVILA